MSARITASLFGAALVLTVTVGAPTVCRAADITVSGTVDNAVIKITGGIVLEDSDKFQSKTYNIYKAIVELNSTGGNTIASLLIGEMVRSKGFSTVAYGICTSGCAFIWLAGKTRYATTQARIGFHGSYSSETGQAGSAANALLGGYLTRLGLGIEAIVTLTNAPPQELFWLSTAKAKSLGIDVVMLALPQPVVSPPVTRAITKVDERIIQAMTLSDLHLRSAPDPGAAAVLTAPNDFIPKGTPIQVSERCVMRAASGHGVPDGDDVWCPTIHGEYRGWANAYFVGVGTNFSERLTYAFRAARRSEQ
jgi:hypothetical protein